VVDKATTGVRISSLRGLKNLWTYLRWVGGHVLLRGVRGKRSAARFPSQSIARNVNQPTTKEMVWRLVAGYNPEMRLLMGARLMARWSSRPECMSLPNSLREIHQLLAKLPGRGRTRVSMKPTFSALLAARPTSSSWWWAIRLLNHPDTQ